MLTYIAYKVEELKILEPIIIIDKLSPIGATKIQKFFKLVFYAGDVVIKHLF